MSRLALAFDVSSRGLQLRSLESGVLWAALANKKIASVWPPKLLPLLMPRSRPISNAMPRGAVP
jgi:hypothetical protein